ncbi:transcriptional regulator, ArsR family [Desulfovibrio sp. X2]|uniref:ArsR/SmtB family transcription factor n=1 Tax=Desulfovibrio sp. X2 TaxID=941449 RepID=UPI00035896A1|nr:metalloregulator ArsR/SmtB family transcription factor [Desulfovibrio sp. X2]EPR41950.1 transcriptional regulator, ArsR family [Desulfovibrio sp. X2]
MSIVQYNKALADPTRVRLAAMLLRHELNVGELVEILGLPQSSVSHHLRILAEAGLAEARRDGLWAFYRAVRTGPGAAFLAALAPFLGGGDRAGADADASESAGEFTADLAAAARVLEARRDAARRFFDAHAPDWPELLAEVLGGYDLTARIRELMPDCGTAADLGCGTGLMLPVLHEKAATVIGVDHSPAMLARARERLREAAGRGGADPSWTSLRVGELEHLPLRDAEADCALLCMALHHLAEPAAGLAEAGRVLAPGGCLLLVDFAKHEREAMRTRHGDLWLGFSLEELGAWCAAGGLTVADSREEPLPGGLDLRFVRIRKTPKNP